MIKTFEGLVSVKFIHRDDKIFQHFVFDNKKTKKYLSDKRYIVYDKFKKKILELALSNNENFSFIEKREEEDRVVLEFHINNLDEFKKPKNYYFVVPGFIPSSPGCEHCIFRKDLDGGFIYCEFKEKTLTQEMKSCRFFNQKPDLFKT